MPFQLVSAGRASFVQRRRAVALRPQEAGRPAPPSPPAPRARRRHRISPRCRARAPAMPRNKRPPRRPCRTPRAPSAVIIFVSNRPVPATMQRIGRHRRADPLRRRARVRAPGPAPCRSGRRRRAKARSGMAKVGIEQPSMARLRVIQRRAGHVRKRRTSPRASSDGPGAHSPSGPRRGRRRGR